MILCLSVFNGGLHSSEELYSILERVMSSGLEHVELPWSQFSLAGLTVDLEGSQALKVFCCSFIS